MEVILIRHTSVDVAPGTCYGQSDVPLKDSFLTEAAATKAHLESFGAVDAAYTSPLQRCTRLAEFCGYGDAERDPRLMEINFGEWEMKLYDNIIDQRLQEYFNDYLHTPATGGESFIGMYARVKEFLDELRNRPLSRVAIFTHGGVLLCAQVYVGQFAMEDAFSHQTPYGGIISINL